mmetsp:Transcript_6632/g.24823  ORF Transcript_6632/g.24823 Transcript_6632/m.24823 type:complete len:204 (-) Transcript_6632:5910-6521(-)
MSSVPLCPLHANNALLHIIVRNNPIVQLNAQLESIVHQEQQALSHHAQRASTVQNVQLFNRIAQQVTTVLRERKHQFIAQWVPTVHPTPRLQSCALLAIASSTEQDYEPLSLTHVLFARLAPTEVIQTETIVVLVLQVMCAWKVQLHRCQPREPLKRGTFVQVVTPVHLAPQLKHHVHQEHITQTQVSVRTHASFVKRRRSLI